MTTPQSKVGSNSKTAYEQMTPPERAKYNELIAKLDDLLIGRKSKERQQQSVGIEFQDRRISDRRK